MAFRKKTTKKRQEQVARSFGGVRQDRTAGEKKRLDSND